MLILNQKKSHMYSQILMYDKLNENLAFQSYDMRRWTLKVVGAATFCLAEYGGKEKERIIM